MIADNGCKREQSASLDRTGPRAGGVGGVADCYRGNSGGKGSVRPSRARDRGRGDGDRVANRNLWFLLARATGSPAVGVIREFEGPLGSPDGRRAWRKLQEVYGWMTAEEKPQQLLRAELRLAETACAGPRETANFLVGLEEH